MLTTRTILSYRDRYVLMSILLGCGERDVASAALLSKYSNEYFTFLVDASMSKLRKS